MRLWYGDGGVGGGAEVLCLREEVVVIVAALVLGLECAWVGC